MKRFKKVISSLIVIFMVSSSMPTYALSEEKLSGNNRYETAIKVSKKIGDTSNSVVLVNDYSMVDALSATPFASRENAPILLTSKHYLTKQTEDEINRLKAKKVYIIGGLNSVSQKVIDKIKAKGLEYEVINGSDRFETALKIANKMDKKKNISEIAVVSGYNGLPDAVSIAAIAAEKNMPILLADDLTKGTKKANNFIKSKDIRKTYVIGNTNVISENTKNSLPNSERIGGQDRDETNAKIIEKFYPAKNLKNVYVARNGMRNQEDLIDALVVGVLANKNSSPIVISGDKLNSKQKDILKGKKFDSITQVGGIVNSSVISELKKYQEDSNGSSSNNSKEQNRTIEAKNISELKNAITNSKNNDTINFNASSSITSDFIMSTTKSITINMKGTYNCTVTIDIPNGDVNNNGTIDKVVIEDIKYSTFNNSGTIKSLIVKDNNGSRIVNKSQGKIETIEIINAVKNLQIKNDGKINKVTSNSENVKIQNNGTIDTVDGSHKPTIDGTAPDDTGQREIKINSIQIVNSEKIKLEMPNIDSIKFSITGNGYDGNVDSIISGNSYTLVLSKPLVENLKYTLNISAPNYKDLSREICLSIVEAPKSEVSSIAAKYNYYNKDNIYVEAKFPRIVKLYKKGTNQESDVWHLFGNFKVYKKENERLVLQKDLIGSSYHHGTKYYFRIKDKAIEDFGTYFIRFENVDIKDLSGKDFKDEIIFKIGPNKASVSTMEELENALSIGTREVTLKNSINVKKDLTIGEGTNLIIPKDMILGIDDINLNLNGKITGEGKVSKEDNVKLSKFGVLYEPKLKLDTVDNNSAIEIKNVANTSIDSIIVDRWKFLEKDENGVYSTSSGYHGPDGIEVKEIENTDLVTKVKITSKEIIENCNVTVICGSYADYILNGIVLEKGPTINADKSKLIDKIKECNLLHDKSEEGTETGQYPQGSKSVYKNKINEAQKMVDNKENNIPQSKINQEIEKLDVAINDFKSLVVPEKAINEQELNNKLKLHNTLLISEDINVKSYDELNIKEGQTLIIASGKTLTIKNLEVNGRIKVEQGGNVIVEKTKIGDSGVIDKPEIEQIKINGVSGIAIKNSGKFGINTITIDDKAYFRIGSSGIVSRSTPPQGYNLNMNLINESEVPEDSLVKNSNYNSTPILYITVTTPNAGKEKFKVRVSDIYGNKSDEILDIPLVLKVSKEQLESQVNYARYILNVLGPDNVNATPESKETYEKVIDKIDSILKKENITQEELNNASIELKTATDNFKNQQVSKIKK
ncbi:MULTISPECIES: cell wall-binding repeat-containing protein [unclassified Clostridioides]|uniref:cell wall-binding repeat-containing protein n=1 Tax=unclassified Clostridioides TaxID=2635829 RepID=UPI001D11688B|nr:cell wall-binding repeat-containing protein [Clostridioides sp. ES-S-0056-01]MCC0716434.1 cell wall-binding repeat-containing protein [Clostridioides sp. ES-S-0077-01]